MAIGFRNNRSEKKRVLVLQSKCRKCRNDFDKENKTVDCGKGMVKMNENISMNLLHGNV